MHFTKTLNPQQGWSLGFALSYIVMMASGGLMSWMSTDSLVGIGLGCIGWTVAGLFSDYYLRTLVANYTKFLLTAVSTLTYFLFISLLWLGLKLGFAFLPGMFLMSLSAGLAAGLGAIGMSLALGKSGRAIRPMFVIGSFFVLFLTFSLATYLSLAIGSFLLQVINRVLPFSLWGLGHFLGAGLGGALGGWLVGALGIERPLEKFAADQT